MSVQILSRRSSLLNDRPFPTRLGTAELAVNNHPSEPGLFFADNTSSPATGLVKIGPISVGTAAPNATALGFPGNSKGEAWLDNNSTHIFKVYDGSNWQPIKAVASISAGLPVNPVDGQIHYNKSTNKLVIYDLATTAWINIGP
tara:strand:- start:174 stop:605 length:432 start_codon:yes stop_codon:yes gene_type:complete